jgi:hypothetical protein
MNGAHLVMWQVTGGSMLAQPIIGTIKVFL